MNKEIFNSMQRQMSPGPEVRAALSERLAQPAKKRPSLWMRYGAVAACAVLAIGACAVYQLGKPQDTPLSGTFRLHSYVTVDTLAGYYAENAIATNDVGGNTETGGSGGGDQDINMSLHDLEEAMVGAGFTPEEVKEYETIGYQMTWAKWWKFVHQQENSEGENPFNLEDLKEFSRKELFVNTGVLPGGAYVGDAPSQEEALQAYDKLVPHVASHPDWYGGAYIDSSGTLVVCLVESQDPGDKSLELQVLDWTDDGRVAFTSGKYSLGYLLDLQTKVCDALYGMGLNYGCGTDEEHNRLDLTLSSVTEEALALLARLDPDDDAIYVQAGRFVATDDLGEDVTTNSAKAEDPAVHHAMPGGVAPFVPDTPVPEGDDGLIAIEPYYDGTHYDIENLPTELPEQKHPAFVESVPEEDASSGSMTAAYDPDRGYLYPNP